MTSRPPSPPGADAVRRTPLRLVRHLSLPSLIGLVAQTRASAEPPRADLLSTRHRGTQVAA